MSAVQIIYFEMRINWLVCVCIYVALFYNKYENSANLNFIPLVHFSHKSAKDKGSRLRLL